MKMREISRDKDKKPCVNNKLKKKMSEIPKLKDKIFSAGLKNGCRKEFLDYIWEHLFSTQMGYSFSSIGDFMW